jgi:hypothetical protein
MEYEREESMGYILPEQGVFQAVQTLLKAGVQVAAQGAFQGFEKEAGGLMAAWGKDFLGEATVNVLQQVATNAANGFIDANSLEIEDGQVVGWRIDGDQWTESVFGKNALASYVGSFARAGTNELLKRTAVGLLGEGANNYASLIKTASALAGEGVGSLIDGEFSLNLLNLTDILNPFVEDKNLLAKMDMGLFSMNFSKDENGNIKNTSRINSAGANVGGLVGLYHSALGMKEAYNNVRIGLSGADEKTTIALRGISSNGQEKSANLFEEILSGKTTLQEAFSQAVGEIAKTTATEYGKEIGINFEDLNGFELGVVLAHEAMRNGRKDGKVGQRQETRDAVLAHSKHAAQILELYGSVLNQQFTYEAALSKALESGAISQREFDHYSDIRYDSKEDFLRIILHNSGHVELHDDSSEDITVEDWRDDWLTKEEWELKFSEWRDGEWDEKDSKWPRDLAVSGFWIESLLDNGLLTAEDDYDTIIELLEFWSKKGWSSPDGANDWNAIHLGKNGNVWATHPWTGLKDELNKKWPVPFQNHVWAYDDYEPHDWPFLDELIYGSHITANLYTGMVDNLGDITGMGLIALGKIYSGVDQISINLTREPIEYWLNHLAMLSLDTGFMLDDVVAHTALKADDFLMTLSKMRFEKQLMSLAVKSNMADDAGALLSKLDDFANFADEAGIIANQFDDSLQFVDDMRFVAPDGTVFPSTSNLASVYALKNPEALNSYFINNSNRFWNKEITFNGSKVYARDDLFDVNFVSSWKEKGVEITGTNLQRMLSGRAPIGIDGLPVEIHHLTQRDSSHLAEVLQTFHREFKNIIHINPNSIQSGISRSIFNKWRDQYWQFRAYELLNK